MPYLKIKVNHSIENKRELLKKASDFVAKTLGKPEKYVMVDIKDSCEMLFGGSNSPMAYLELKSIGLPSSETTYISEALCKFITEETGVNPERIYIDFSNIDGSMWGWNGATF